MTPPGVFPPGVETDSAIAFSSRSFDPYTFYSYAPDDPVSTENCYAPYGSMTAPYSYEAYIVAPNASGDCTHLKAAEDCCAPHGAEQPAPCRSLDLYNEADQRMQVLPANVYRDARYASVSHINQFASPFEPEFKLTPSLEWSYFHDYGLVQLNPALAVPGKSCAPAHSIALADPESSTTEQTNPTTRGQASPGIDVRVFFDDNPEEFTSIQDSFATILELDRPQCHSSYWNGSINDMGHILRHSPAHFGNPHGDIWNEKLVHETDDRDKIGERLTHASNLRAPAKQAEVDTISCSNEISVSVADIAFNRDELPDWKIIPVRISKRTKSVPYAVQTLGALKSKEAPYSREREYSSWSETLGWYLP